MCLDDGFFLNAVQRRWHKVEDRLKRRRQLRLSLHQWRSDAQPCVTDVGITDVPFALVTSG